MKKRRPLEGKIAIVTGSSRGIGAESAKLLAKNGAKVVVNYLNSFEAAQNVVKDILLLGGYAKAIQADVTKQEDVKRLVNQTISEFGHIDVLVLNASISFPVLPFTHYSWEDFELKLNQEIKAAFFSCQAVIPYMVNQEFGNIVMISSGLSRMPSEGMIAHSTAKSGIDAFAKSLALEMGSKGVRVNVVAPGLTETDATKYTPKEIKESICQFTPLQRLAKPQDIASAELFLVSDNSSFITGAYIPISGGIQMN